MKADFFATKESNNIAPIGYDKILTSFKERITNNKFAPINLICAAEGVGKRKFAEYITSLLLGDSALKYSELNLHPDLMIIDNNLEETVKKEITIDSAREIKKFLQLTSAESGKKIIIIDAIDKLNNNAANSILKILEEPPTETYFLLICHNIDKILPTIISRSQKILPPKLTTENVKEILQNNQIHENLDLLTDIFPNQPGQAINFSKNKGVELLNSLTETLQSDNITNYKNFSTTFDFKKDLNIFTSFLKAVHYLNYKKITDNSGDISSTSEITKFNSDFYENFHKTLNLNLDRENFILNNLFTLHKFHA